MTISKHQSSLNNAYFSFTKAVFGDQYHEPHHLKSLCHHCIRWKLIVVITGVREQTMLIRRHRFQEEQPQPPVQAEWMLVNGQLVCEWQPLVVEAETDHPLYLSNCHKAA